MPVRVRKLPLSSGGTTDQLSRNFIISTSILRILKLFEPVFSLFLSNCGGKQVGKNRAYGHIQVNTCMLMHPPPVSCECTMIIQYKTLTFLCHITTMLHVLAHNKKDPRILQIPHQRIPSKIPMPTHISNIREICIPWSISVPTHTSNICGI